MSFDERQLTVCQDLLEVALLNPYSYLAAIVLLRVPRSSQVSDKMPRNSRTCQGSRPQKLLRKLLQLLVASVSCAQGAVLWPWWLRRPILEEQNKHIQHRGTKQTYTATYSQIPCLTENLGQVFWKLSMQVEARFPVNLQWILSGSWAAYTFTVEIRTVGLDRWDISVFPLASVGFGLNSKNSEFHQLCC